MTSLSFSHVAIAKKVEGLCCFFVFQRITLKFGAGGNFLTISVKEIQVMYMILQLRKY